MFTFFTGLSSKIKWALAGVVMAGLLLLLFSWWARGNSITTLNTSLATVTKELADANHTIEERKRTDAIAEALDVKLTDTKSANDAAFEKVAQDFSAKVQAEVAQEAVRQPAQAPLIPVVATPVPSHVPKATTFTPVPVTPPQELSSLTSTNISQLSLDAAWDSYCRAVEQRSEACRK